MAVTRRLAVAGSAVVLALTPAVAVGATHKTHHRSAAATCAALRKKEGVKRFDARYGTGKTHRNAMKRCIARHARHRTTKKR